MRWPVRAAIPGHPKPNTAGDTIRGHYGPPAGPTVSPGGIRGSVPPKALELGRGELGVAHRVLDVAMAKVGLQRARLLAIFGELEATSVAQHVGMHLDLRPAVTGARSSIRAKPAVENGAPRSETNTNGEAAASRCSLRKARISSPVIGWVAGVPPLTLRTCRLAKLKST